MLAKTLNQCNNARFRVLEVGVFLEWGITIGPLGWTGGAASDSSYFYLETESDPAGVSPPGPTFHLRRKLAPPPTPPRAPSRPVPGQGLRLRSLQQLRARLPVARKRSGTRASRDALGFCRRLGPAPFPQA